MHPGYGFLSENADFAQAVIDAGLTWIGPPPDAIRSLGDKVSARHIAQRAGAPQVPGTADPVTGADEVVAFAKEHGLPVAIKAAFGGGGRGLKVARTLEEIPDLYDSAVREAVAAFGRGECFVERYLDNPRHVETQCLADMHGNVVVVSTRDCSLQRRHQKLVEEAPAPFLSDDQLHELYASSKAIIKEAGYYNAGTCEFLVGTDGTISFLEVNTRLQVEHPVTEEVAGIDLVREQFRIAEGGTIDYADPVLRGHSFEFRINGEDPGRNFLPAPGELSVWKPPSGPGIRVDSGFEAGDVIGGNFDSLLAKLIVTGATREEALERVPPGPRRVRGRGHRHRDHLPPRRRARPRVRARARRRLQRPHALDRDRVRQHDPRLLGGLARDGRGRRARDRRGRGRWQAGRGHPARRTRRVERRHRLRWPEEAQGRQEGGLRCDRRLPGGPDAGHHRQGRGGRGPGGRPRATSSSCSRP